MTFALAAVPVPSIVARAESSYREMDEQRDVFESHRHHIFSVAYYMTGDEREAESILSSTFIQAFRQQSKPGLEQLDRLLMVELQRRLSLEPVPAMSVGGANLGGRNVRRTDLEEVLWRLPARERLCFLMRDVEGYTPSKIAGLLESPETEVRRTVLSARMRIRALLVEQRSADA